MIHMAWSETYGCYNICRFPIGAVLCVFDATFNNISDIYFVYVYSNNYPFTSGAHTGGEPAVRLKYNHVHITI